MRGSVLVLLTLCACHRGDSVNADGVRVIEMAVTEAGFEPSNLQLKKGQPVILKVTRETDQTCATELLIQGTELKVTLPLHQMVEVAYTPSTSGRVKYGCAMGMMISGVMLVE